MRSGYTGKRALDVVVAIVALVAFSPVILAVAVAVRVQLGFPVLFRQTRPGRQGTPFVMLKFRTMHNIFGEGQQSLPDVDRLGAFGRFLRATSLDELPELWNVLRGEMSLVGPRPLLMEYLALYDAEQARRHEVHPGITGWAQVNGRNAQSWEERFVLDVWYVDNSSLILDLRILWLTIYKVLAREGITYGGDATMPKFRGTAG
jgi:lipopolysaccharide/colanic/teichoic acid biosynthesis glycosyltransferase